MPIYIDMPEQVDCSSRGAVFFLMLNLHNGAD